MSKSKIKVIKRDDVKGLTRLNVAAMVGRKEGGTGPQRNMAKTISSWIETSRRNKRALDVSTIRRVLGSSSL